MNYHSHIAIISNSMSQEAVHGDELGVPGPLIDDQTTKSASPPEPKPKRYSARPKFRTRTYYYRHLHCNSGDFGTISELKQAVTEALRRIPPTSQLQDLLLTR
jgi:hypothetical protein